MTKLAAIDGNSLINRAFYAMPPLTNSKGQFTNAVYGFTTMLIRLIADLQPQHIAVAFDLPGKTFRHTLYEGYKATRKGMPDELAEQVPLLKELLRVMGICIVEREGLEADDMLGALAAQYSGKTYIITGDRDALQLIDERTVVLLTRRGITDTDEVTAQNIHEKFGLSAAQVIDYKALAGDSSDCIPGVRGVGDKTALSLLDKYGSLDGVYAHIEEIPGKLGERLSDGRESAYLSRKLATIDTGFGLNVQQEALTYVYPLSDAVRNKFEELEFRALVRRGEIFQNSVPVSVAEEKIKIPERQSVKIKSTGELSQLISNFSGKVVALDFAQELSLSFDGNTEYTAELSDTFFDDTLNAARAIEIVAPLLKDPAVTKTAYDTKALRHALLQYGTELCGPTEDVSLKKYLCDFSAPPKGLKDAAESENLKIEQPACSLFALSALLDARLKELELEKLYRELELPLSEVLFDMERVGFAVEAGVLDELGARYSAELEGLSQSVYALAGKQFNINSSRQLQVVLFDELGLKPGRRTKTGLSTGIEVLEELEGKHAIVPLIMRHRKLSKLLSTYIEGFRPLVGADGIIHTLFRQAHTTTGRLSSTEPNLQNLPIRGEEGREIRRMFVPRAPGNLLYTADYSQIELRLLAHFSGDEKLTEAFLQHKDIHASTAAEVFGQSLESVTADQRRNAKAVNFGIIYGISDFGLARQLDIPVRRAAEIITRYMQTYPRVREYMDKSIELAKGRGYASTLLGRRRRLAELYSKNYNLRSFGERAAMNMPLQGTAADIIKIAMLRVYRRFAAENMQAKLILQVHDELVADAPASEGQAVKQILREEMENCVSLSVPLEVNVSEGSTLYDA